MIDKHLKKGIKVRLCCISSPLLQTQMDSLPFNYHVLIASVHKVDEYVSAPTLHHICRQQRRASVLRLGMYTQNKQTDLLLRGASAKWECYVPLGFSRRLFDL